jgi:hypothetical protein
MNPSHGKIAKRLLSTAAALLAAFSLHAQAIVIPIDPGPVGPTNFFSDTFADLNGQPLDGSAFLLDFVFTDMKHVETIPGMSVEVVFDLSGLASNFNGQLINAFLSDENGNNIGNVGGLYDPAGGNVMTYRLTGLPAVLAHDVHMEIVLPTDQPLTITGASFSIFDNSGAEFEVGVWGAAPEPATFALFGLGLAGLGWSRRKKV